MLTQERKEQYRKEKKEKIKKIFPLRDSNPEDYAPETVFWS